MVCPIRTDFEPEEKKNTEQDGRLPITNIAELRTVGVPETRPETCPLWKQTKDFYAQNYPTDDVSFRIRMPVLGLVVTLVTMHYFITTVGHGLGWNLKRTSDILYFAYFVLAAVVAFELWWGLNTNNKKHTNVWILLKTFEISATIYAFMYYMYDRRYSLEELFFSFFYCVSVIGLNSWIFHSVLTANFEQEGKAYKEQDSLLPIPNIEGHRIVGVPGTWSWWEQTKSFYRRNFLTNNVSFRIRTPVLGLVVTLVVMHYLITTVGNGMFWVWNGTYSYILYFAYFVLATGAAFELWWGLNTNNKKHINVWILLKTFEISATIYPITTYIHSPPLDNIMLLYFFSVIALNSWIFFSVLQSTKGLRNQRNTVENSIDTIFVR